MHAVVGAGIAGLVATKYIADSGRRVIALEKDINTGGRLKIIGDTFKADAGAQFVTDMHVNTLKLITNLKLKKYLRSIPEPSAVIYDGVKFREISHNSMSSDEIEFMERVIEIAKNKKLSFTSCQPSNMSISEWITTEWDENLLENFVQPWITALTLSDPENLDAAYCILLIFSELSGVYTIEHGMGMLSKILSENIVNNGGIIRRNSEVIKLEIKDGPSLLIKTEGECKEMDVNTATIAVPAPVAAEIVRSELPELSKTLRCVKYSTACQIVLGLENKIWNKSWSILVPRTEMKGVAAICKPSIKCNSFSPHSKGMIEIFIYGEHAKNLLKIGEEKSIEYATEIIETILPGIEKKILWHNMSCWEYALPLYDKNILKVKESLSDVPEGIFLAGDYIFAPSIEAAVTSGILAGVSACETQHISGTELQGD